LPTESLRRKALWALLIAGLIFVASSRSTIAAPRSPFEFLRMDKIGHFAVYGLLGTLLCRMGTGWRGAAGAVLAASAYGASDEWHQSFVPGRSVEVTDWLADTLGAAVAVGLYAGVPAYRRALEKTLWRRPTTVAPSATERVVGATP
jgi:VanZ family protein